MRPVSWYSYSHTDTYFLHVFLVFTVLHWSLDLLCFIEVFRYLEKSRISKLGG